MGGILPSVKHETYSQYDSSGVAFAESAFLTVWAGLGSCHEDLVLVGEVKNNCHCTVVRLNVIAIAIP
jgi:hypothetical protein